MCKRNSTIHINNLLALQETHMDSGQYCQCLQNLFSGSVTIWASQHVILAHTQIHRMLVECEERGVAIFCCL